MSYVEEGLGLHIQSPNNGRKKNAKAKAKRRDREIKSSLLILDLKDGKL